MQKNRPISPHLIVYKPQITSVFSIFHRISGSCLSLTLICSVLFLYVKFFFSFYFSSFIINVTIFSHILLCSSGFFVSFIFCFHIINGCRHMSWDLGLGLELKNIIVTSILVLSFSIFVILTAVIM
jgi:succinate dehydrogenase / fumarate reductase cytochrome b subunit